MEENYAVLLRNKLWAFCCEYEYFKGNGYVAFKIVLQFLCLLKSVSTHAFSTHMVVVN